ncbi:MAG: hypothetical protein KGH60_03330 [Candidatus Micrarchaeota archaeon]|nr:hypothetical protein [Candidatus Micrarchaeota archaeon]
MVTKRNIPATLATELSEGYGEEFSRFAVTMMKESVHREQSGTKPYLLASGEVDYHIVVAGNLLVYWKYKDFRSLLIDRELIGFATRLPTPEEKLLAVVVVADLALTVKDDEGMPAARVFIREITGSLARLLPNTLLLQETVKALYFIHISNQEDILEQEGAALQELTKGVADAYEKDPTGRESYSMVSAAREAILGI